jgi:hypothetical protein
VKTWQKIVLIVFTGVIPGLLIINHLEAKEQKAQA